jgi:hypothetical protein
VGLESETLFKKKTKQKTRQMGRKGGLGPQFHTSISILIPIMCFCLGERFLLGIRNLSLKKALKALLWTGEPQKLGVGNRLGSLQEKCSEFLGSEETDVQRHGGREAPGVARECEVIGWMECR